MTDRACTVEIAELPGVRCGEPAVAAARTGCVHEHIDDGVFCADCLDAARNGEIICTRCRAAGYQVTKAPILVTALDDPDEMTPDEYEASARDRQSPDYHG